MDYNPKRFSEYLSEETKDITFVFGRFNPPTNGHEKVFDTLKKKAGSGQFRIYASQSNDPKKNPLKCFTNWFPSGELGHSPYFFFPPEKY